MEEVGLG